MRSVPNAIIVMIGLLTGNPVLALAQQSAEQVLPLSTALEDLDGDLVPDRLRDTVTVEGLLTGTPFAFGGETALGYLQDKTASGKCTP